MMKYKHNGVLKAFKTELKPNNVQRTLLLKSAGTARFAYNWGLARRKKQFEQTGKSSTCLALRRELNHIKRDDFPWMMEVSKCCPQEALRDLENAYQRFFDGQSEYPNFKTKRRGAGAFTVSYAKVNEDSIQIPRIGNIRLKEKNYLPTNQHILSTTISEHAGRWFVSVQVDDTDWKKPDTHNMGTVGVDLGINHLATISDGTVYANPKTYRRNERKLVRLQRSLSRKVKGSNNRNKARQKVAKLHFRIENIRKDVIHKITTELAKTKSVIVIEDLNNKGMMKNHKVAKSLSDAAFGEFRRQLQYKTKWYGSELVVAKRWFPSTQRCSRCGNIMKVDLSERVYTCPVCGLVMDRDLNASKNLEAYPSLKVAVSSTETLNACGELTTTEEEIPMMQVDSVNQESNIIQEVS